MVRANFTIYDLEQGRKRGFYILPEQNKYGDIPR